MRRAWLAEFAGIAALLGCAAVPVVDAPPARRVPDAAPSVGDPALVMHLEAARTELALPGAAALVFDAEHTSHAAVGYRSLPTLDPLSLEDRFHLGSDGKAMTATLLAVLIESGSIASWDATLGEVFVGEAIDPALTDVTLAELAAHRAGLPRDPEVDDDERAAILAVRDPVAQRDVVVRRELGRPPASARGAFVYSNIGFVLLGAAIERAAGAPFEEVMVERLFTPLAMRSCTFDPTSAEGAYGHAPDGSLADASTMIPPAYAPAGGVHCTLDDWARFVRDHLRGEAGSSELLRAESYRRLHTPTEGSTYAFGWNITTTSHGRLLAHAGSNGFWIAVLRAELDTGRAVLFGANIGDVDLERLETRVHAMGSIPSE